ncbi:sugar phosphatase [Leminorella grimontii]|uniref:Sugar phosphatase n=1 Tax=Leminorella grimontii TaxID=82981 RepID=A0AAV5MYZ3_9GAMM|nr:sugar phosphatase [Leminorella grimontii]KFC95680.1 putative phosphatase [Leminorella grimontii ATCC 33999 = DSM 5078]GKX54139.1 sugar phosphatase [Leminorella grimontii]GKX60620.1 sugar phosphatase [Leminorella grimontii]VFS59957.1 Phosphatase YfbT [Leminorella grimontii]
MNCKGFLFDLDGTLVSSLAVVERSWLMLANKYSLNPKEVLDFIHGKQAITSLRHFMAGYSDEDIQREFKALEHQETVDTDGIVALPGAVALLNRLNELGIPWAIVTSGTIPIAQARSRAAGIPLPEVFVTAELVARGKPEPDAYLLGAQRLGFLPQECVVVEDAAAGIASGLAAGCQVIAVNAENTPDLARVDRALASLEQISVTYENGVATLAFSQAS